MKLPAQLEPALFEEINGAILDLQASGLQTFERPLKRLSQCLHLPPLQELNNSLTESVDLDAFLKASEATGGGMVGSHRLAWPDDKEHQLGLTLLLIDRLAADMNWAIQFCHTFFYSGTKIIAGIHTLTSQLLIPFARDYRNYAESKGRVGRNRARTNSASRKVFVVHGHDEGAREMLARFLERIDFMPIILHEQANRGMTVAEKLEAHSDVGFAVVLMTPDDLGRSAAEGELQPRARQNVLLELGFFVGLLGRDRVCALKRGEVEIPSDYLGVIYTKLDDGGGWRAELGRELHAAGYEIDWNKVMVH